MKLANQAGRATLVVDGGTVDLEAASDEKFSSDVQEAYQRWDELLQWAGAANLQADGELDEKSLGAPAPRPGQIFALGLNYSAHINETGHGGGPKAPPVVFSKFLSSVTGPYGPLVLPSEFVDWEVELVVTIGRTAYEVSEKDAWNHVAGITIGQDISERHVQNEGKAPQFSLGKSFPGFAPTGPYLLTVDEVSDPQDLELATVINGVDMQRGRTSQMVYSVAETIARLSVVCPLSPGDLIFTGTPGGVGAGRDPQVFLKPSDVLVSTIEGIGEMRQECVSK